MRLRLEFRSNEIEWAESLGFKDGAIWSQGYGHWYAIIPVNTRWGVMKHVLELRYCNVTGETAPTLREVQIPEDSYYQSIKIGGLALPDGFAHYYIDRGKGSLSAKSAQTYVARDRDHASFSRIPHQLLPLAAAPVSDFTERLGCFESRVMCHNAC